MNDLLTVKEMSDRLKVKPSWLYFRTMQKGKGAILYHFTFNHGRALKVAELPIIRFHDLRHTYASLLIEQGENIKYISNQPGHTNPTTTLNIYAHLIKQDNQEAGCKLENTIFQTNSHNLVTNEKRSQPQMADSLI